MNIYPIRENFAPTHLSVRCLIKHAPSGVHSSVARAKSGSILKLLAANSPPPPPPPPRIIEVFGSFLAVLKISGSSLYFLSSWQYLAIFRCKV